MLFLSHILNARIADSADNVVGKLIDIMSYPNGDKFPAVAALVYKESRSKLIKTIPLSYVENLGPAEITLNTLINKVKPCEIATGDLWLARDVLDKQIVDLEGTRVVRANDLRFGSINGKLHVLGIDVSTRGILRRLGLDRLKIFSFLKPAFIDWEKVQIVGKSLKLSTLSNHLVKLHPADLANIVEDLNLRQSENLMQALDTHTVAKVVEELDPEVKHHILKQFDEKRLAKVMSHLSTDELVDYLKSLPKTERHSIISGLGERKKMAVQQFIRYRDDTAGGLMTTEFIKAESTWSVAETREFIRKMSPFLRSIYFAYVINEKNELLGTVSLRTLLISSPHDKLNKIMKHIRRFHSVNVGAGINEIGRIMTKYNLLSLAILDQDRRLVGVVTVDDIMRRFLPHA